MSEALKICLWTWALWIVSTLLSLMLSPDNQENLTLDQTHVNEIEKPLHRLPPKQIRYESR